MKGRKVSQAATPTAQKLGAERPWSRRSVRKAGGGKGTDQTVLHQVSSYQRAPLGDY